MKKKRYSEEQIVRILQEAETGIPARDLCRKHNIAEQTFYRWKSKYGGMDVSEAKRLKRLKQENAELKKGGGGIDARQPHVARHQSKKVVRVSDRRRAVDALRRAFGVSERWACRVLSLHRSSHRYCRRQRVGEMTYQRAVAKSQQYAYWGYRKIYDLLVTDGVAVGREQVRRIRRREGLQVPRTSPKRRRLGTSTQCVLVARYPNHV